MKHVAFDLEIVKELPDGQDWEPYRPFGVSIISTCTDSWNFRTWPSTVPPDAILGYRRYPDQLTEYDAHHAADYLLDNASRGCKIVTWNGLGFDFRVLVEALPKGQPVVRYIAELACSTMHIDIGFAMLCETGYMCGLQAACEGFGLPGKSDGISGKLIPALWKGTLADQEQCLEYCRNDVAMTSLVYHGILHHGKLIYKAKSGIKLSWVPKRLDAMDVVSVQKYPEPGKSSWPRSKFTGWLGQYL